MLLKNSSTLALLWNLKVGSLPHVAKVLQEVYTNLSGSDGSTLRSDWDSDDWALFHQVSESFHKLLDGEYAPLFQEKMALLNTILEEIDFQEEVLDPRNSPNFQATKKFVADFSNSEIHKFAEYILNAEGPGELLWTVQEVEHYRGR